MYTKIIRRKVTRVLAALLMGGIFMGVITVYGQEVGNEASYMPINPITYPTTHTPNIHTHAPIIPINEVVTLVDEHGNPLSSLDEQSGDANQLTDATATTQPQSQPVRLFPSSVEEIHFENNRRIIRTYHLAPDENPMDINVNGFEREGFYFTLLDITRNRIQHVSSREYVKVLEIETRSQSLNAVLEYLSEYMEYECEDGYMGVLLLDLASLRTQVAGHRTEGFTQTEHRTFPNLSNPDVSLVPQSIIVGNRELILASVSWSGGSEETIDYTRIANTFTAHATYTHHGTRSIVVGYVTVAEFRGVLTRINEGETTYTAVFTGIPIGLHADSLTDTNGEGAGGVDSGGSSGSNNGSSSGDYNQGAETEPREPFSMNWGALFGVFVTLGLLGAAYWFFVMRGNVEVFNLQSGDSGDKYVKIGRAKVSKKSSIIDLSPFTDKAKTSAFRVDIAGWVAMRLNGETITANYGSGTLQHEIAHTKGQKKYQVEFDF